MSPRAAWRLERLGFTEVYDYVPGKMDWLAADLPHEGDAVLAGDFLEEVATCGLAETLGAIRSRLGDGGGRFCVVTAENGLVAGTLRDEAFDSDEQLSAEEVMTFGVTTVRPSEDVAGLLERMAKNRVEAMLVTNSEGQLLGRLVAERAHHGLHAAKGGA